MLVRRALARHATALVIAALLTLPCRAQTRTTLALGPSWVDFTLGNFAAVSAQLRLQRGPAELSGLAIVPVGGATAVPDCLPNVACFEQSTPNALWGGIASLSTAIGSPDLRGSAGLGAIAATGMKGPGSKSSAVGSLGLDWVRAKGTGLTLGARAIGLASNIAGMRYLILPTLGFRF